VAALHHGVPDHMTWLKRFHPDWHYAAQINLCTTKSKVATHIDILYALLDVARSQMVLDSTGDTGLHS